MFVITLRRPDRLVCAHVVTKPRHLSRLPSRSTSAQMSIFFAVSFKSYQYADSPSGIVFLIRQISTYDIEFLRSGRRV